MVLRLGASPQLQTSPDKCFMSLGAPTKLQMFWYLFLENTCKLKLVIDIGFHSSGSVLLLCPLVLRLGASPKTEV